jgi:hypothetical protein
VAVCNGCVVPAGLAWQAEAARANTSTAIIMNRFCRIILIALRKAHNAKR